MLMLVCFRCIDVFTYEEGHRCLPSSDDEDMNDTEHLLLIEYEPVSFLHGLTKSNREASIETSGEDFNRLSASIPVSPHNESFSRFPSIKPSSNQASDGKFNLLEQNRSLPGNNFAYPLETSSNNESQQQDDQSSNQQTLVEGRDNASTLLVERSLASGFFVCERCGKNFRLEPAFIVHVRSNCDPEPYKCDLCPKKFEWKSLLTKHRLIHTEEKRFKCDQCPYASYWTGNLKTHKKKHH